MVHRSTVEGQKVAICAPFGRDADSIAALLRGDGYDVEVCPDLTAISTHVDEHIGAILLTEEALHHEQAPLREALRDQPGWSDVPFVLLAAQRAGRAPLEAASPFQRFRDSVNNVVLERPLGKASLTSAVASAMRSRQKQFEMRDRLRDLSASEDRLRLATEASDVGTWDHDLIQKTLDWDARCKATFGMPAETDVTQDLWFACVHHGDRNHVDQAYRTAILVDGAGIYDVEYRTIGMSDGVERWVAAKGACRFVDDKAVRFIGTIIDITERKRTEAALTASEAALRHEKETTDRLNHTLETRVIERTQALETEMASRTNAEAALRQSQKMEAVGQLTGGIAHDFNNMLTGVIGGLDIIKRRIAAGKTDDLDRFMDAASTSAQRAAGLTARLLAFSRRQSLDAKALDVNELVHSLEELLRRTIPENIALGIVTPDKIAKAVVDANQLENAILNLAINARDAMPEGGQLTVETSLVELDEAYSIAMPNVKPGRYVMVAVSDTGVGMPPEVLEKVFDPFFTTKPIGQGTGLGMSMVYGFARQSGGQVRVHSRPGEGTSVKIYLPATSDIVMSEVGAKAAVEHDGRGQTVLLVEDDESVRLLVREVLAELHYHTLEAGSADEALPILHSDQKIDLLVSDVGLPGMNGRQLAELARNQRPDLPVLFVTGYAENAAMRAGFLGTNMSMITKPFSIETLAAKIDEMIC